MLILSVLCFAFQFCRATLFVGTNKQNTLQIKLTIPVRDVELEPIEACGKEFDRLVLDLTSINQNAFLIKLLNDSEEPEKCHLEDIRFNWIEGNSSKETHDLSVKHSFFHSEFIDWFLVIEVDLIHGLGDEAGYYEFLMGDLLRKLSMLLHLTFGTSITFLPGVIYQKQKYIGRTGMVFTALEDAYINVEKTEWPLYVRIELRDTLQWLCENEINFHSYSDNPAARALNAFSYLFLYDLKESRTHHLFWCMLGLEALYNEGKDGVMEQFQSKSKLVLGEPEKFKKQLKSLYNNRSELIHGNVEILPKYGFDRRSYRDSHWTHLAFGTSVLVESLRQLIKYNLKAFRFRNDWEWLDQASSSETG